MQATDLWVVGITVEWGVPLLTSQQAVLLARGASQHVILAKGSIQVPGKSEDRQTHNAIEGWASGQ
jgi:hypothetical protein